MIWKLSYLNFFLSIKEIINHKNIEKISNSKLKHIEKMYDKNYFEIYKTQIFMSWLSKNMENTLNFSKRAKKLIKKLDITLTNSQMIKVENIESREFTQHRALKIIETPYKDEDVELSSFSYFFYKNIRTYEKGVNFFKKIHTGEIFITPKEIVLYDQENNKIQLVIKNSELKKITLLRTCVKLEISNKRKFFFRYKDNELIYISLNRISSIRNSVVFSNQNFNNKVTFENMLNSFLKIR